MIAALSAGCSAAAAKPLAAGNGDCPARYRPHFFSKTFLVMIIFPTPIIKSLRAVLAYIAALAGISAASAQVSPTAFEERLVPGEIARANDAEKTAPAPTSPAKITEHTIPAVLIRGIQFEGADVPARVADAARPFIARTLTHQALSDLAAAMTAAYQRSDVALFTIAIPDQDFADGIIRVLTAEGHIERFDLSGEVDNRNHFLVTAYAERLTVERPISRKTLQRNLALMSDIPGLKIEPVMGYGAAPGAVTLNLKLDNQRPTVSFGYTNRTSRLIKDGQFSGEAKLYRLLRDGDFTSMQIAVAANMKDSLYVGGQHSTPLGTNGVRVDVSAAALKSRPSGTEIEGDAQIYSAGVNAPIIRSPEKNLSLRASFDILNSDNAAFGALIATERTRAARLAATASLNGKSRKLRVKAGLSRGLNVFGADVSEMIGAPQFIKASGDAVLTQKLGPDARVTLHAAGQWTQDTLPANERFTLGGGNFGRAFSSGLVSADRGFGVSLEPAWRPLNGGDFHRSEFYAFADYTRADIFSRSPMGTTTTLDLGSYGAGLRAAWQDKGFVEIEVARPFDQPVAGFDQDWRLSLSWRLDVRP